MDKLDQIEKEIKELKKRLKEAKGRETEIYTRIVGYYRSIKNWNKGKSEEKKDRLNFVLKEN